MNIVKSLLLVFVACALSFCKNAGEANKTSDKNDKPAPYLEKSEEMFGKVWKLYRVPEHLLFSEYYPMSHRPDLTYFNDGAKKAQEASYLWPMSGVFSSTVYLAMLDRQKYQPYIDSMVVAVEMYYDDLRMPAGYQAYPVKFGVVDRYYDDNGLVGIDYIDAYMTTGNELYLERAKHVMTFIMSGWRPDYDGGVAWVEGTQNQKPCCANGKAMVLALKLFKATKDPYYLTTGIKFYDWIEKYLHDNTLNIVLNSWLTSPKAGIDNATYSYNTGLMIEGAVSLYNLTGKKTYLDNARKLAEGSYKFYMQQTPEGKPRNRDIAWFYLVLFRGYHDLYNVDGNTKYVDQMIKWTDWAYSNAQDNYGLIYSQWSAEQDEALTPKWLLDESCMTEFFARAAVIKGERKIVTNNYAN